MDWNDMNQAAPPLRRAGYIIAVCWERPATSERGHTDRRRGFTLEDRV